MRKSKKLVALCSAIVLAVTAITGVMAYFTDYETQSVDAKAGTLGVKLEQNIDITNGLDIVNPGDVAPFDFTVTNTDEKSADVYAVVTVTGKPRAGVTASTDSPYKLLANGSAVNFDATTAEVTTVEKDGKYTYIYTLPVNADVAGGLIGSVEKDATKDGTVNAVTYEYEIGMDKAAINEWQDSTVDVKIEVFAKQHRNTSDWMSTATIIADDIAGGTDYAE